MSQRRSLVSCPRCFKQFDISYARAFACSGCPSVATGSCGSVRCPHCGHEFPRY